jgi:hypothetical protein
MKNKLILVLILTILFLLFIAIRFFILDRQNNYGGLKILSSPSTSIFINNVAVGKTPFESKYKAGEYILKLIPEGMATEAASWTGKIKIYKNALTYVNFDLGSSDINTAGEIFSVSKIEKSKFFEEKGEIYVETEPQGAIVSLDNDEKGVAPLILENVTKGEHEISIFMPNFFRRTQKVNVVPGYRINSFFKLAIDESQKMITPTPKQNEASPSSQLEKFVVIKETPSGWLRVRTEPSINASESAKIKPGEKYPFIEERDGWYKIRFNGKKQGLVEGEFDEGWVSSQYATLQ